MTGRKQDVQIHASYADFYTWRYGPYVVGRQVLLAGQGAIMNARQPAGDFSDAATPDHVFLQCLNMPAAATFDLGWGNRRRLVAPKAVTYIPPDQATSIIVDESHEIRALGVNKALVAELLETEQLAELNSFDGEFHDLPLLHGIIECITTASNDQSGGTDLLVGTLIAALLTSASQVGSHAIPLQGAGGLAPWKVRRVRDIIDDRLAENVLLRELASEVMLSQFHLCRAFKAATGLAPHQYQIARRVECAKDLLAHGTLTITAIAARVGYDDPNQLARVFRKSTGVSPTQYRRDRKG